MTSYYSARGWEWDEIQQEILAREERFLNWERFAEYTPEPEPETATTETATPDEEPEP